MNERRTGEGPLTITHSSPTSWVCKKEPVNILPATHPSSRSKESSLRSGDRCPGIGGRVRGAGPQASLAQTKMRGAPYDTQKPTSA